MPWCKKISVPRADVSLLFDNEESDGDSDNGELTRQIVPSCSFIAFPAQHQQLAPSAFLTFPSLPTQLRLLDSVNAPYSLLSPTAVPAFASQPIPSSPGPSRLDPWIPATTIMVDSVAIKAPTGRDSSTTPMAPAPAPAPAAPAPPLATIAETRNESTGTLVGTKTPASFGQVPGNVSTSAPAPDTIRLPRTIPGNVAEWLPTISSNYGRPSESGCSTPNSPMSPEQEAENSFQLGSSPDYTPIAGPPTRRESFAESTFSLARVRSEESSVAASALSDATGAHFRDLDERLRLFLLDNEPQIRNIPAEQISTTPLTAQEVLALPFSFECAFGWSGDRHDLEATPKSKEAFLCKLHEAKNGCTFIHRTLSEYQMEVNSRKNHKFGLDFLKRQNEAIVITRHQLDQIEEHIDEVIVEVSAISDDDEGQVLTDGLTKAYAHAYPWVMRTKRVVHDNHVWYKLNYVMGAHTKPTKIPNKNGKPVPKAAAVGNGTQASSLPTRSGNNGSNITKALNVAVRSTSIRAAPASSG